MFGGDLICIWGSLGLVVSTFLPTTVRSGLEESRAEVFLKITGLLELEISNIHGQTRLLNLLDCSVKITNPLVFCQSQRRSWG